MIAISCGRPSAVLPISTSFMRSDSASSFCQYCSNCVVVGEQVVVADVEAELLLRRRDVAVGSRRLAASAPRNDERSAAAARTSAEGLHLSASRNLAQVGRDRRASVPRIAHGWLTAQSNVGSYGRG